MTATTFRVDGIPAPQGSKRHVGRGILIESSKALKPWRERIAWTARELGVPLRTGAVTVQLAFVMPRPVSTPKRRTPPAMRKPDLDKLTRGVFDALSGLCFEDDARIVDLRATKRLAAVGEQPGLTITIADLTEELA
ncbi:RusA family crossover junction endodeoxyribonuclease [Rhodococcoides corynebacterioides]|uniref:RusA family crossover junction endodeoxyribonuclease n=1 Tax=Rhodococcoides corynebacterioides TaxID=53972 RepID=UPI003F8110AB